MDTLVLSAPDLRALVREVGLDHLMDELVERLQAAIRGYDPAATRIPARDGFDYEAPGPGLVEWMPLLEVGSRVVVKTVGYHPRNPASRNLPTILSSIASYDVETGHLAGIADGTMLTALRTGASSAVASRAMARPTSSVLGLIGCGAQAVTQLHALVRSFPVSEVLIWDTDRHALDSFPERIQRLDLPDLRIEVARPRDIAARADIVTTATSIDNGAGPVFADVETRPWAHFNAVGSDFPGKTELPLTLLERAIVCPDFPEQALREGECQQLPGDAIGPSLTDVLRDEDRHDALRERVTVFDSTGWALEDHVALDLLLECAEAAGLGTHVALESVADDPKDPYGFLDTRRPDVAPAHMTRLSA